MRELLGSDKFDDKQRAKLFKKMFGYYDKGVFTMMSNKFKKLDLIGIPYQIIIGSKSEADKFEFKELKSKSEMLSLEAIKSQLKNR